MSKYNTDRSFTDSVHWNLAMKLIYEPMTWTAVTMKKEQAKKIDMDDGIDYVFLDENGQLKTVQERFREAKYLEYNDFTIRYRRDKNSHAERRASEFYKIKADYFVYGITNGYKAITPPTDFLKFAVIDLKFVQRQIEAGKIQIKENQKMKTCFIENEVLVCPVNENTDGSSNFFPIDIQLLVQIWGNEVVKFEKGFLNPMSST